MRREHPRLLIGEAVALVAAAIVLQFSISGPGTSGSDPDLKAAMETFIARGYQDVEGRRFPLFAHLAADRWLPPVPVYAGALAAAVSNRPNPFELASGVFAALTVGLVYCLVRLAFDSRAPAIVAAVLLILTPAHVAFARTFSADGMWQVPFACGWLLAMALALRLPASPWPLACGVAIVVASTYTQPSAALMAPILFAFTLGVWYRRGRLSSHDVRLSLGLAAAVSVPMLLWFASHWSTYADTFGRWFLHPANIRNPLEAVRAMSNWSTLTSVSSTYWDFFSPAHLAFGQTGPGSVGVFLLPAVLLVAVGAGAALRPAPSGRDAHTIARLALLTFILLPLAAASFNEARALGRALAVVPMGVVVATYGVLALWPTALGRAACYALMIGAVAQFCYWITA